MMDSTEIKITRVINPSRFFFIFRNEKLREKVEQHEIQLNEALVGYSGNQNYSPKVGNICAFFNLNKWIRVMIDNINGEIYTCWCLDYGVPICSDQAEFFAPIEKDFQIDNGLVQQGCLHVLPAAFKFDFDTCAEKSEMSSEWSSKAVKIMQNFTEHSTRQVFVSPALRNGVWLGDVEFSDRDGRKFSLRDKLLEQQLATVDTEMYSKLVTSTIFHIHRWDDNEKSGGVTKSNGERALLFSNFENPILSGGANFTQIFNALMPKKAVSLEEPGQKEAEETQASMVLSSIAEPSTTKNDFSEIVAMQKPLVSSKDVVRILVQGNWLKEPLENIGEAHFTKDIHNNLRRMNFKAVFKTQSYSWPNILEGRSVFIVGSKKSGKTFSYLPAVLSLISTDKKPNSTEQGPTAIIIVRSSREVERIYSYCYKLLPRNTLEVVIAFGAWNCENKKIGLLNGCELLITTPPCFSRLAIGSKVYKMFNKNRIRHLIFDGLDSMQDIFEEDFATILKTCTKQNADVNPQIIVTTNSWMEYLRKYTKLVTDPILIFGNAIEGALYAKCRFSYAKDDPNPEGKLQRMQEILRQETWKKKRTLIMVNDNKDFYRVYKFLIQQHIEYYSIDANMSHEEANQVEGEWAREGNDKKILLMTDDAFVQGKIKCAQVLIHFSLPSNWTSFSRRFSALNNTLLRYVNGQSSEKSSSLVLLDNENYNEVPRLIDFLKTRGIAAEIPQQITEIVQNIVLEREQQKADLHFEDIIPVCPNIFQFGECVNYPSCKKRHAFIETDRVLNIPCDGLIKFDLLDVSNPTHYNIKVREYLPLGEKRWISCETKNLQIEEALVELQKSMRESAIIQMPLKTNDLCALYCPKKVIWARAKIVEKQKVDEGIYKCFIVLIDFGQKFIVKSNELMVLPQKLKYLDPLVSDLRILNLIPFDKDETWDSETTNVLSKFFTTRENTDDYCIAKVEFSVHSAIFTRTFDIRNYCNELDVELTKYALASDLLTRNFCLKDETVATKLKHHLKRAGLYVPDEVAESNILQSKQIQKSVAALRWQKLTVGENYEVQLKQFNSPELFHVVLANSVNSTTRKLFEKIENCNKRDELLLAEQGEFCLVTQTVQKASRGIISKVEGNELHVFLLDFGETIKYDKSQVFQLPPELIETLSFQGIQCRMLGVKPKFGLKEWHARTASAFGSFINEHCAGKILTMRVVAQRNNSYDVVLQLPDSGDKLDEIAVDKGFAAADNIVFNDKNELKDPIDIERENEQNVALENLLINSENIGIDFADIGLPCAKVFKQNGITQKSYEKAVQTSFISNGRSADESAVVLPQAYPAKEQRLTLKYVHKYPRIEWRQNDLMILLYIAATDSSDYALKVRDSSIEIHISYDTHFEKAKVYLYSLIDTSYTSHQKSGQRIIVRIVKEKHFKWPRLSSEDDGGRFIVEGHDEIHDIFKISPGEGRQARADSDSEEVYDEFVEDTEKLFEN